MIKSVLGGRVSVYLYDDGQDVDIPTTFLTHVPPMKGDKVMGEEDGEERVLDLLSLSLSLFPFPLGKVYKRCSCR